MGADLSRVRFDARADINKIVQQQGRVLLDADANEQQDVTDRRQRAQAADLGSFGVRADLAGTAVVPRTTPDAFTLRFVGGALRLGRGRMYVDGLLAENHGTGTSEFDPLLAELRGADDTPYLQQPYWPEPDPLPTGGRHLVYLEVCEREVTWVEEPDLIDPGVAVDTTARAQVIWQARVHAPSTPGITCATADADIPGWEDVLAATSARLTVGTIPVPPADDPCSLPPSGDYRGLENQTYRVEIHTPGPAGTATFKWSRDNATVAIPVVEVTSSSRLRLASLGKDADSLGIESGQWVEVLDDAHELAGRSGELRQITVHPEDQSVSFAPALPAGWPTTTPAATEGHLRVRRWDGTSGSTTIPAPAAAVELEHGITVNLTATPGEFRTGEYWIFAARTATASVEMLDAAPPHGPHRHLARLGIIEGAAVITDRCAPLWPPEYDGDDCACTACVSTEGHASGAFTIQDALDRVAEAGGTVCLGVGDFRIDRPLVLAQAAGVRLRGHGPTTVIRSDAGALVAEACAHITVEDLTIVSSGKFDRDPSGGNRPGSIIGVRGCVATTLQRLTIRADGEEGPNVAAITLSDLCVSTRVHGNDLAAPVGVWAAADVEVPLLVDDLTITENRMTCTVTGVFAADAVLFAHDTRIAENRIEAARGAGIHLGGVLDGAARVQIKDNRITVGGHGIVSVGGVAITGNHVSSGEQTVDEESHGIQVRPSQLPGQATTTTSHNQVEGFDRALIIESVGEDVEVSGNDVTHCGNGIFISSRTAGIDVAVRHNSVTEIGERGSGSGSIQGVLVAGAGSLVAAENTIGNIGAGLKPEQTAIGLGVIGTLSCRLTTNLVYGVGNTDGSNISFDYAIAGTVLATFTNNQSLHDLDNDGQRATGLYVTAASRFAVDGRRAMMAASSRGSVVYASEDLVMVQGLENREPSVAVADNTLTGGHLGAAINAEIAGTILLSHNHCTCPDQTSGAITVTALTAAITGNRVFGGAPSMQLAVSKERLTVLGNLASNGISAPGGLDSRWASLNLDGVL
ncbi:hypothetical protein GCM10027020_06120 [Nocardioides salsibiostraticola]